MRSLTTLSGSIFACTLLGIAIGAQRQAPQLPVEVPILQLIATPERFQGRLIETIGYMTFALERGTIVQAIGLSPSKEASENGVLGGFSVDPDQQLIRDREKLQNMYVIISGVIRIVETGAVAGHAPSQILVITHVRHCIRWSDPDHPVGLQSFGGRFSKPGGN